MVNILVDTIIHDARWKTKLKPYTKTVQMLCEAALAETSLAKIKGDVSIAVVLADDSFIKSLNHDFRGKAKPTNVLSFPTQNSSEAEIQAILKFEKAYPLGDIALAFETIEQEAEEQQKTFRHHAAHLIIHGLLHLLGHDHMDESEAQTMEEKEIKILKKLGVTNPYL